MTTAERARDEALEQVSENAGSGFTSKVRETVADIIPTGREVTGEDIRIICEDRGIEPHHHNAWGAVIRGMIHSHLEPTGEHEPMQTEKSHARKTPVYVVVA